MQARREHFVAFLLGTARLLTPLSRQNRTAVYVEDFAGNKAGVLGAEEKHGTSDLLRLADAAHRNRASNLFAAFGIGNGGRTHVGVHPPRGHAVHVNARRRQFGGKAFYHADDRTLGGGIIAVVSLAALAAGGAD